MQKKLLETPPKRDLQSLYERARARSIVAEAQHDPVRKFKEMQEERTPY